MDGIRATPMQYPILGLLADKLKKAQQFAVAPGGYANPPAEILLNLLGVPAIQQTMERVAYGEPLTTGRGMTTRVRPEVAEAAMTLLPAATGTARVAERGAMAAGRAGERLAERMVPQIMERGGMPAGLLHDLAQASRSNVVKESTPTSNLLDYRIEHRPMTVEGGASRLHDAGTVFGEDVYGKNALQYFGSGLSGEKTSLDILKKVRGNPDAEITIYRGVPEGVNAINKGDWVTLDPKMAEEYGNVISKKVKARDITTWPDSLVEFGYYPD